MAKQLNLDINNNNTTSLYSANGGKMTVFGSFQIALVTRTGTVFSKALVTSNLAHPVLLSWHDLILLGVINNTFPRPSTLSVETSSKFDILRQLPKVLKDELNITPMMQSVYG